MMPTARGREGPMRDAPLLRLIVLARLGAC